MFTIKVEKENGEDVYTAAKYTRRGRILNLYAPRLEVAYVLPGDVLTEVHLDDPEISMIYIMNGLGKTVDRFYGAKPA